jgi:hypothetical protein
MSNECVNESDTYMEGGMNNLYPTISGSGGGD